MSINYRLNEDGAVSKRPAGCRRRDGLGAIRGLFFLTQSDRLYSRYDIDIKTKTVTEWNVGCERCHGPGSEHAANPTRLNIVNPAKLDFVRANDTCIQCHSQGQPLKNPIEGQYYDWPVGFHQGLNLKDFWRLEEHKLGETNFMHFADGTGHKVLLTGAGLGHPTVSPDGKRIAFNRQINYDQEIYVKNLVDGTVKRLTTSTGADMWPTWSPDGGKIAFSSFRSGKWQIWTMSSTGGSPTRITHTSNSEQMPAFSH